MFGDLFGEDNDGGMSVALAPGRGAEERARMLEKPPEERSSCGSRGSTTRARPATSIAAADALLLAEFRGGLYSVDPASLGVDLAAEAATERPPRRPGGRDSEATGVSG